MYLRFRNSQLSTPKRDGTFEELYEKIHGKPLVLSKPYRKPNFRVQIYLVKSQWINGRSKQIYIGVLANVKVHIDKNKKLILTDEILKTVHEGLIKNNVPTEKHKSLLKKIESYFSALENWMR